ncbi:Uncharacterized protein involved in exopolysaccharide biosynthesis [Filomicrobium insigne]|uniref:Uncharacterized protein involved in exopolysaccharide biosynthesis n=1 Tax=Filomicrobium insigne TaxID=418854 RepID=A0A1H0QLG4_9HYPH|nr:exopolysaccharide transport family protein [Filomicrobium insigne]SDP17576.1 Uncharacterized protein involved in exopolysaccharide biosynthesis [Filomicrobium insigne]
MRDKSFASPDDIDLMALWATLRRAMPKLLVLTLAAGILTYVVLSMMAPRYTSQAEMAIVAKGTANPFSNPNNPTAGLDTLPSRMDKEAVNTHVHALLSSNLAARVIKELQLDSRREFNASLGPVDSLDTVMRLVGLGGSRPGISDEDEALKEFFSRLDVYSPAESRVINIQFTSVDPGLAAKVANTVAETYREELAQATVAETDTVQKSLAPRIEALSEEVSKAESEVANFRAKAGLLRSGAQQTPLNEQQLGDIASELTRASATTSAAQTRAKAARQLLSKRAPEAIPEVQASPIIQNLIQQRVTVERDLLKLSATMKPAHPVIRQLNADLNAVKQQISAEVANLVAGLDREAFIAAEQEAAIRKRLDAVKIEVADSGADNVELRQLEARAAAKRGELERLQAQFEANRARADGGVVPVEAQIIALARPSSVPVFPRKVPYTVLVMVGTLLLGTAIVITVGLAAGARKGDESECRLREEIAVVAASDPAPVEASPPPLPRPNPETAEAADLAPAFRSPDALAEHLVHSAGTARTGQRTILASHADPATTVAVVRDAANAMTEAGAQTLIIDGSFDGDGLADAFQMSRAPGFTELISGAVTFSDVVRSLPGSGVHIIACGAVNASDENVDADQLNMILDALDEAYDQILVVARAQAARAIFETIQGRFDIAIIMDNAETRRTAFSEHGTFLGFTVSDIELLRYETEVMEGRGGKAEKRWNQALRAASIA